MLKAEMITVSELHADTFMCKTTKNIADKDNQRE